MWKANLKAANSTSKHSMAQELCHMAEGRSRLLKCAKPLSARSHRGKFTRLHHLPKDPGDLCGGLEAEYNHNEDFKKGKV